MPQYPLRLVVHGGAGALRKALRTPKSERAHHKVLKQALKAGFAVLKVQGSSLAAVREAVKVLEDSALFNAGYGSVLTQKGKVELDASIMDGYSLKAGSVAGVSRLANPIQAAELIFEHSKHVMLIGKHAEYFARRHGLKLIEPQSLITAAQWKHWQELKDKKNQELEKHGTVGAVALDCRGNLAAATSTGGIMNKAPGRVGDSPIIGAGTYADNATCAVSATGQGEYFIRLVFAYDVAAQMRYKKISLEKAGVEAIRRLTAAQGKGGFIALDRKGAVTMPFNTEAMYRGVIDEKEVLTFIY
jgi:beta-aspartyl-peptidase (threonine type)